MFAAAANSQILIDGKVAAAIEGFDCVQHAGELHLKGFNRPVRAFNVGTLGT